MLKYVMNMLSEILNMLWHLFNMWGICSICGVFVQYMAFKIKLGCMTFIICIMINVNKPNFELNQLYINSNLSLLKNVLSLTLYELITSSPLSFVPLSTKPNLVMNILYINFNLSLSNDDLYYLFYELLLYRPHMLRHLFQILKNCKGNLN